MRLSCWLNDWKENRAQNESLGVAFASDFCLQWQELKEETNEEIAMEMIVDYLLNVSFSYPDLPHRTGDRF